MSLILHDYAENLNDNLTPTGSALRIVRLRGIISISSNVSEQIVQLKEVQH